MLNLKHWETEGLYVLMLSSHHAYL